MSIPVSPRKRNANQSAFTLLELFVVVSVVGILGLMLLPVLASGKMDSKGQRCVNNTRQLVLALHLYASDNNELLPPNEDNNNRWEGWVAGDMTLAQDATNTSLLTDPAYGKLARYTEADASLYRCPADPSTAEIGGRSYPRVRSVSMNQAVGTKRDGLSPVEGSWLNEGTYGNNTAKAGPYRTYGRLSAMISPSPERLWIFADEDPWSINDGALAVTLRASAGAMEWIDRPASFHGMACGFAFGDGHAEIHRWSDARTPMPPGSAPRARQPDNPDILWVMERTTARLQR